MKPVVVLVGRPNVGKSTLFNRLTKTRDALVADFPGLTRDRHYGEGRAASRPYLVVDTGGFEPVAAEGIMSHMATQTRQAIIEADIVVFLTDGRTGLAPHDRTIAQELRTCARPVILAVNKTEGMPPANAVAEFYELGLGEPHAVSSAHGDGVRQLIEDALAKIAPAVETAPEESRHGRLRLAVAGRPNVGKSTFVNALLGEERVIAFDMPGTTRDSIEIDFERGGKQYTLIDTAGLRRKGKVFESIEKFSVIKTLQSIADANVVVLMLDAMQDISDQDAHIAGYILETGRALVIAINKWDGVDEYKREQIKRDLERKLVFLNFAKMHFMSATEGFGIGPLMRSVSEAHAAAFAKLPTPKLTRALIDAVAQQQPARKGFSRPKMRYAHQGGQNPPTVIIHGNSLENISDTYRRFLEGRFREKFKLVGTPLKIEFRTSSNPYSKSPEGKSNK